MRTLRLRFRIGTMMTVVAVIALLSWLVAGLGRGVAGLIGYPPLFLVLAAPILFALSATILVTLSQRATSTHPDSKP